MAMVDSSARRGSEGLLLTVIAPSGERRQVRVTRSPFRIGRLPDRDLTLKDARISRDHAAILLEDGVYYLENTKSRHGVYLNGRRVERARLRPQDRIGFGADDSYQIVVGEETSSSSGPLLRKVAQMPSSSEGTGNLNRLSAVLDVARALESSDSVDDVLAAAVDAALGLTGAERGFLLLKGRNGELEIRVARDHEGRPLPPDDLRVPRTVIAEALRARTDLFAMSFDSAGGAQAEAGQTVLALELRSVVCVPLVKIRLGATNETRVLSTEQDTVGALYMDTRRIGANLAEGNQDLLQTLGVEISTVLENARLLDEERKKHNLEQELQIAREIQQGLLPATLPSQGWLAAAGSSEACFQVGGDYYDMVELSPERWGVVLADVSGKGIAAALLNSLLQGAFFAAAASETGLAANVGRINRYVCERSRNARFATVFCCVAERSGRMRWLNAGHCAGLLARADGTVERLEPSSYPIGLFPEADFPEQELRLAPGDRLALYSDGVSEAANFSGDRYGEERLTDFLKAHRALHPTELHRALKEDIGQFTQGAEQNDDLTLLLLGYEGTEPQP
ncbi:MAG: SpoIIE family protein phosphatase [Acidobacteria bacterium]|nr:SpoIIE family protein phosphatase [Acidobacteriota bacterium]